MLLPSWRSPRALTEPNPIGQFQHYKVEVHVEDISPNPPQPPAFNPETGPRAQENTQACFDIPDRIHMLLHKPGLHSGQYSLLLRLKDVFMPGIFSRQEKSNKQ